MMISVKVYHHKVFGKGLVELTLCDGATVKDAFGKLDLLFGARFEQKTGMKFERTLKSVFNVFLNGNYLNVQADLECKLKDGDRMVILRPVSGG